MSNDTKVRSLTGKCIKGKHWQCHQMSCDCRCHKEQKYGPQNSQKLIKLFIR